MMIRLDYYTSLRVQTRRDSSGVADVSVYIPAIVLSPPRRGVFLGSLEAKPSSYGVGFKGTVLNLSRLNHLCVLHVAPRRSTSLSLVTPRASPQEAQRNKESLYKEPWTKWVNTLQNVSILGCSPGQPQELPKTPYDHSRPSRTVPKPHQNLTELPQAKILTC